MTALSIDIALARRDFSLEIRERIELAGITGLFGPSGAGKTTLLRCIAGLEPDARGRISLGEALWQDDAARCFMPAHRREIGYVFQDGELFTHLSVEQNLRFATRFAARGLSPEVVISALDLEALLHRRPASLSAGERQRTAIARALLRSPRLLLMDEPLSALDDARKREILPYIERLPEHFGLPVIYVTHNVEELARLAGQMLLFERGRIRARGSVVDVLGGLDLPMLGEGFEASALLEATVAAHRDDITSLDLGGLELRVPPLELATGAKIRIRVPARDVALALERPSGLSIRNALPCRIEALMPAARGHVDVVLGLSGQRLRARVTANAARELGLTVGLPVFALVKSIAFEGKLFG